jgi:molybdenum cofactor cytidylyltransferase
MPAISTAVTGQIVDAMRGGAPLVAPVYRAQRGHPVGFSAEYYEDLCALDGDCGARAVLQQQADKLVRIVTWDPGVIRDIDSPEDLKNLYFTGSESGVGSDPEVSGSPTLHLPHQQDTE